MIDLKELKLDAHGCTATVTRVYVGVTPLSTAPWLQCSMWSTAGALQRCSINGPGSPAPAVAPHTPGHQHEGGQHSQHSEHDLSRSVQATVDEASTLYLFTLFFLEN